MADGDDQERRRMLATWDSLIESQKSVLRMLDISVKKSADVETAITLMGRRISHIEDKVDALSAKMDSLAERLQSVGRRFEDVETQMDRSFRELAAGQAEMISLENKILSAMQTSLLAETRADDMEEQIVEIRHRLGM